MQDEDTIPIKFDRPTIKYPLTPEDWDRIKIWCGFQADKESQGRDAVEYIIDELIRAEVKPVDFVTFETSLEKILPKIDGLLECIHELKTDPEVYEVLIDDDSEMIPASFAAGEQSDHDGHQRLLGFIGHLRDLSNRITEELGALPTKHRKNDARALRRLVASYDEIVATCSDRHGIERSKKKRVGKVDDLKALQEIFSVAQKQCNRFISKDSIDTAMRRPIAARDGKADPLEIRDARMIEPSALFRLVLNGGQPEVKNPK